MHKNGDMNSKKSWLMMQMRVIVWLKARLRITLVWQVRPTLIIFTYLIIILKNSIFLLQRKRLNFNFGGFFNGSQNLTKLDGAVGDKGWVEGEPQRCQ